MKKFSLSLSLSVCLLGLYRISNSKKWNRRVEQNKVSKELEIGCVSDVNSIGLEIKMCLAMDEAARMLEMGISR